MRNGSMWYDDAGRPIQAHGGMILKHNGKWYWYGEHKGAPNLTNMSGDNLLRVNFIGISCYSSDNLRDWHYEGLVFEPQSKGMLCPENVCERPKVVYNGKTKEFVMWMHVDLPDYCYAGVGVAVSKIPTGPFQLLYTKRPNGQDSRDMTVFVDYDDTAYLVHSSNWNQTMNISRLTEDYRDVDGLYVSVLIDQNREAPAIIYEQGRYYMITSGCTGWNYNSALVAESHNVLGRWKLIDNPCEGDGYRDTFKGQSTYLFRDGEQIYLLLDHWIPESLQDSGYSILPVFVDGGRVRVVWKDKF